jgi:hypothetical protein
VVVVVPHILVVQQAQAALAIIPEEVELLQPILQAVMGALTQAAAAVAEHMHTPLVEMAVLE